MRKVSKRTLKKALVLNKEKKPYATSLVGSVNNGIGKIDDIFLEKLETLMKNHKIQTINVAWQKKF